MTKYITLPYQAQSILTHVSNTLKEVFWCSDCRDEVREHLLERQRPDYPRKAGYSRITNEVRNVRITMTR